MNLKKYVNRCKILNDMRREGLLIVISGPSGVGKGTLTRRLVEKYPEILLSVSCTTREPRAGEVDGEHYHFISESKFDEFLSNNEFFEYATVFSKCRYGTLFSELEKTKSGVDIILEIDVQGGMQAKHANPDCVLIFIAPPSLTELASRLSRRGTEDIEKVKHRLEKSVDEIKFYNDYDFVVVNDEIVTAVEKIKNIIDVVKQNRTAKLATRKLIK